MRLPAMSCLAAFMAGLVAGGLPLEAEPVLAEQKPVSVEIASGVQRYKAEYRQMTASGYAPLDKKAVRGMCYSGNRHITASGKRVKPGVTVAADKSIPFGTEIVIMGLPGVRVVEDRGGAIKGDRLDICFQTRSEALRWGKRPVTVVILRRIAI